jgi:LPS-assembly lipoprotein
MMRRLLPLFALALTSCALHPLYGGGASGDVGTMLRLVKVAPIDGQTGWLVRNKLVDRLRARYQLVNLATGGVVLDATAGSDAGIDVVSSEYATVAAEQSAVERLAEVVADQIVARLGVYAARTASAR